MKFTKARQIELINVDFDLNTDPVLEQRQFSVRQWDEVWEPALRQRVLQQISERTNSID
ncbi:hypothetical protein D3C84_1233830 [compost metagenome]